MAWLSNLAGKAEDLLNRLDHNASIVLLQNESNENNEIPDTNTENNDSSDIALVPGWTSNDNHFSSTETKILSSGDNSLTNSWGEQSSSNEHSEIIHDSLTAKSDSIVLDLEEKKYDSKDSSCTEKSVEELELVIEDIECKYSKSQKDVAEFKKIITDYEGNNAILKSRLKQAMTSLAQTQEEMEKHRSKAQKILEDKERLVAQIENTPISSAANEHIEYISKFMKNRDDQQKSVDELNEKLELVQNDLSTTQKQCSLLQEETISAREALQKEEKNRQAIEDELTQSKKELNEIYEELKKHRNALTLKEEEISYLCKQLETRTTSSENEELESKFHVLTQTLIMKQNSVETLTTERNALRLQLERVESDYSRVLIELNSKQASSVLNIENFDEGRSASIFAVSPFDEGVTRRVKRAISTINTFSIRLGVFLRRYPVARVFLLCYMILLQIWVVVILFAYVPSS